MPKRSTRTPEDRMVDLQEGGVRTGYASESLRKFIFTKDPPPPFFKVHGRWRAWLSDLDAWAESCRDKAAS